MKVKILQTIGTFIVLLCATEGTMAGGLQAVLEVAYKNSPALKAKQYAAESLEAGYNAESWLPSGPNLTLGYRNIPAASWPSFGKHPMSGVDVTLSQKFAAPSEYYYRNKAARSKYMSAIEKSSEFKRRLVLDISLLYHSVGFFERKIQILKKSKRSLSDIVKVARALVRVNKMNSSQLLKIEADLAIIDNRILETEGQKEAAVAAVNALCGKKIKSNMLPNKEWEQLAAGIVLPALFHVKSHPLYKATAKESSAAAANASHEKAKLFPGITVAGGYTYRDEIPGKDTGEDFVSLRATFPIPLYYGINDRHKIKAKSKQAEKSKNELKQVELLLTSRWQGEVAKAEKALAAYKKYELEVEPKYLASYKAQVGALASGSVSLMDVLDSYRRYLEIAIAKAKQYRSLTHSQATLKYLAGDKTEPNQPNEKRGEKK